MYEVLKTGGLTGGFNFDAKNRRASYTFEDMFYAYILGMDTFALGLINAAKIIEDGRIDEFKKNRYSTFYNTEMGKKIISDSTNLEELFKYAENLGAPDMPGSGRQEYLQSIVNGVIYGDK
jgi:xylose isomerase